ncbi:MAG: FtsL-like putative cell division protein [Bacteroidia bacterium]|jgi:hypothetical protein|nr:FtsL-like putative cell division protein [Bacteroidia bacterium]
MTKNTIKEKPQAQQPAGKAARTAKPGRVVRTVGSVMSGSFLTRESVIRSLPFIFFVTLITLLYIANGYYAEEQIRKSNRITNEIKELRSAYIITKSDLMFISKQSEVARRTADMNLKESLEPPQKIVITYPLVADTTKKQK